MVVEGEAKRKGLELLEENSKRRVAEVRFLSGGERRQGVVAWHVKEAMDQCRLWGAPVN